MGKGELLYSVLSFFPQDSASLLPFVTVSSRTGAHVNPRLQEERICPAQAGYQKVKDVEVDVQCV